LECAIQGRKTVITENTGAAELSRIIEDPNCLVVMDTAEDISQGIIQQYSKEYRQPNTRIFKDFEPRNNLKTRLEKLTLLANLPKDFYPFISEITNQRDIKVSQFLSIIVPFYNSDETIVETLDSIAEADNLVSEIILVNDGSSEESKAFLSKLQEKYSLKVIHQANRGLAAARNTGLKAATTEYVMFLDSDDLIDPRYLENAIEILNKYRNVAGVGCWVSTFGLRTSLWETFDGFTPLNFYKNTLNSGSIVWSRNVVTHVGGFNEAIRKGFEDWNLVNRILAESWAIPVIDRPYFFYRLRKNSMFSSLSSQELAELYVEFIEPNIVRESDQEVVSRLTESNQAGYSYTYLLQPPMTPEAHEIQGYARKWAKNFPCLRTTWEKLPLHARRVIFSILKTFLNLRKILKSVLGGT
jgi:glycosyltransferase involved in cell wall biosynthesis